MPTYIPIFSLSLQLPVVTAWQSIEPWSCRHQELVSIQGWLKCNSWKTERELSAPSPSPSCFAKAKHKPDSKGDVRSHLLLDLVSFKRAFYAQILCNLHFLVSNKGRNPIDWEVKVYPWALPLSISLSPALLCDFLFPSLPPSPPLPH